jgi:putative ABC transport system substrate-binding protein
MIQRRDFITLLGGAAAWPLAAARAAGRKVAAHRRAHPVQRKRSRGEDFRFCVHASACRLGWIDGRNVRMDLRWFGDDNNQIRALAQELVGLQPDIILANGTAASAALQRETGTVPIVFANLTDPVASGIVSRLERPRRPIYARSLRE